MNTRLSYLYRDGANYKQFNEMIFSNLNGLSLEQIRTVISRNLIDELWFIAKDWKLPDLHFKEYLWDAEIDHDWHEFVSIDETNENASEEISIDDFILSLDKKQNHKNYDVQ